MYTLFSNKIWFTFDKYIKMKKFVAILLILVGTGAFAQPTSGDIIMVELDSADTLLSYAAPALTFEEANRIIDFLYSPQPNQGTNFQMFT